MFNTHPATPTAELDKGGQRWRIGLIALSTDLSVEQDFFTMLPGNEIGVYISRVKFTNPTTRENLLAMQPRLTEAAELILPGIKLDSIAFACTSASAVIGNDAVEKAVQSAKPGTPCATPTTAVLAAMQHLGLRRITVLAPYLKQVSEELAGYFSAQGLDIVSLHYMDLADDRDIGRVSLGSIEKMAVNAAKDGAEALFLSCTGLRAVPLLKRLEDNLGMAVISSNQALFWQSLRLAGYAGPVQGFGRLLES